MTKSARAKAREWDIWKPSENHPHWRPDEQTYAINPPGYYNQDLYNKIDSTISKSAYDSLMEDAKKLVEALKFECGDRCAQQNPCNAKDAIEEFKRKHGG